MSNYGRLAAGSNDAAKEALTESICSMGRSWASLVDVFVDSNGAAGSVLRYFARQTEGNGRTGRVHDLACKYRGDMHKLENDAKKSKDSCRSLVGKVDDNDDGGCKEIRESEQCIASCSGGGGWSEEAALFCGVQAASYQKDCK